jgi:hypothetical protein
VTPCKHVLQDCFQDVSAAGLPALLHSDMPAHFVRAIRCMEAVAAKNGSSLRQQVREMPAKFRDTAPLGATYVQLYVKIASFQSESGSGQISESSDCQHSCSVRQYRH